MNENIILRISSKQDPHYVKDIAGAIGWQLREHGCCRARAIKANAVNTVTKALAIVNERLSQAGICFGFDLFFSPADTKTNPHENEDAGMARHGQASPTAVEMLIQEYDLASRPDQIIEYKVSGQDLKSDKDKTTKKLAGAISSVILKDKLVQLRCIGPRAVYRAILACCLAKGYSYSSGKEIFVVPSWASLVNENSSNISFIKIDVWASRD